MIIHKIVYYFMDQNIYILYDEKTLEGVIIDPGAEADEILRYIDERKIKVKAILLTHGHGDHIGAIPQIKRVHPEWPVAAHECELDLCEDASVNLSRMIGGAIEFTPDITLKDNEIFTFGDSSLKALHTPGHTPGGVCFYSEEEKTVIVGDTLFYGSIGRTDFPNTGTKRPSQKSDCGYPMSKNYDYLINSIKQKLFTLPDDTKVFPGHGESTSIGFEKKNNPFVRG